MLLEELCSSEAASCMEWQTLSISDVVLARVLLSPKNCGSVMLKPVSHDPVNSVLSLIPSCDLDVSVGPTESWSWVLLCLYVYRNSVVFAACVWSAGKHR